VDKTKAENLLLKYYTNTDYTIIRPGGLVTADATEKAVLTEDKSAAGKINRADVAKLVISAMFDPRPVSRARAAVPLKGRVCRGTWELGTERGRGARLGGRYSKKCSKKVFSAVDPSLSEAGAAPAAFQV
jgi:hypothetical protein